MGTSTTNAHGIYIVSVRDITRQLTEMEWSKSRYLTEFKGKIKINNFFKKIKHENLKKKKKNYYK